MRSRNIWIYLGVVVAVGSAAVCFTIGRTNPALVTVSPTDINFGSIPEGVTIDRVVIVTNHMRKAIRVTKIFTSCGCTTTSGLGSIGPNATADLHIRFASKDMPGPAEKLVSVNYTSSGQDGTLVICLRGVVNQFISMAPAGGINLGLLNRGQISSQEVEVMRNDGMPLRSKQPIPTANIHVTRQQISRTKADFNIIIKAPLEAGQYFGQVLIPFSDGMPSFAIPVRYSVASFYHLSKANINFGLVLPDALPMQTVAIEGTKKSRLSIARVPNYLQARISQVSSRHTLLTVQFRGGGPTNTVLSSPIELWTDNGYEPKIYVPVYAIETAGGQAKTQ